MTRRRLGHPCHPIKLTTKDPCNANGPNGFMEPRYRDAGVRGAWSASRHGRLPLIVDVTFIRSKATGHTTSTDPSRSHTLRASAVGLSRPTEGGSRRRGGAEPLLLGEQPLADGHRVVLDGRLLLVVCEVLVLVFCLFFRRLSF